MYKRQYVYAALDRLDAHLDGAALPADAVIDAKPRGKGESMKIEELAIPR